MPTVLPSLFVSHGSPTFALETTHTSISAAYLQAFAVQHPTPRAIVIVSPHWQTRDIAVTSGVSLETIHDFGGFADELYTLQYPAKGSPELAQQVVNSFTAHNWPARLDNKRGLDHGAWVPLMKMYPKANIPVIQVSLPYGQTPEVYYDMGQVLAQLRQDNVLVIASGSMTHNLYEVRLHDSAHEVAPYVSGFTDWVRERLAQRDMDSLLNYRSLAPFAAQNHPTDEHYVTLYVAMGAAGFDAQHSQAHYFTGEKPYYTLAMDNVTFS